MLLYAVTILVSAFLLFQIQPLAGKLMLPWFGGAAAVWAACLLFFQVVLLLGYLYAHAVVRFLRPRAQALLHIALLVSSLALLRILPDLGWKPAAPGQDPLVKILGLLAASVGLPYFLLSTTGPLAQAWYARVFRAPFPYRLFAVSNLGSLLGLLTYPVLVEPHLSASSQAKIWSAAYAGLCLLFGACAWRAGQARTPSAPPAQPAAAEAEPAAPSCPSRLLWVALAAGPSALLLAVTNHVTQNVSPVPLLWVAPLGLYLASFILTFGRQTPYRREFLLPLLILALAGLGYGMTALGGNASLAALATLFSAGLFICCLFCHAELARRKPHSRYLTGYYLFISLGGALGGAFVAALAPRIFPAFFELPIAVVFCALLGLAAWRGAGWRVYGGWTALIVILAGALWYAERQRLVGAKFTGRNFYGMLRVVELDESSGVQRRRRLLNGTILHGLQFLSPAMARFPTAYYGQQSGAGLAIEGVPHAPRRIGVIGLGTGTLAAYGKPGDYYRFYEINPLVIEVARHEFSYLADCPAKIDIVLGDARLSLAGEADQRFDVLAVDAFSSDSIPVHLLTKEAFELYFRHLRPDGVLAVHISNRYLDLEPVVRLAAEALKKESTYIVSSQREDGLFTARWLLLTSYPGLLGEPIFSRRSSLPAPRRGLRPWTDDYSNLFQILRWTF